MKRELREFCDKHGWQGLSPWTKPSIGSAPCVVVIMMPGWSKKDFEIAETVAEKTSREEILVEAYDIDEIMTQEAVVGIVPLAPPVTQTPVVAYFVNGEMRYFAQGPEVAVWDCRNT